MLSVLRAAAVILLSLHAVGALSQSDPATISAATMDALELGLALPASGDCAAVSADDRLIGSFDLLSGQNLYQINNYAHAQTPDANVTILQPDQIAALAPETRIDSERLSLRPDRNLLLVQRLGAFELSTGLRRLDIYGFVGLSPDGALLAAPNDGIYDTGDWTLKIPLSGDSMVVFSPDSRRFAVSGRGVFNAETGQQLFPIGGSIPAFSPDGRWLATEGDGVYAVETGARVIAMPKAPFVTPRFSPDSRWLADASAVYDLSAGTKAFDLPIRNAATFSPDSQLVVGGDGGYALASGERRFELNGAAASFSADGSLVASVDHHVYDVATGTSAREMPGQPSFSPGGTLLTVNLDPYCLVYGLPGAAFPFRSGLIAPLSGANVRRLPVLASDVVFSTGDLLAVSARTPDGQWYRVFYRDVVGWVSARVVRAVEMPDGIPVEDPMAG